MLLAGCHGALLHPAGPIGMAERSIIYTATGLMLVVVAPVIVLVVLIAWRYRASNTKARYEPEWSHSTRIEVVMWTIPVIIVSILGVIAWRSSHQLDPFRRIPSPDRPIHVEAVALNWKWLFIYPQYHIATVGELGFAQDRPVSLRLTSDTVMQSFMIPALVGQIYAMPGMVTRLNFAADRVGRFGGMDTQYDGSGFHTQHFAAVAMGPRSFQAWVRAVKRSGVPLGSHAYRILGRDSTDAQVRAEFGGTGARAGVTYFHAVASGLFRHIVQRYHRGTALSADEQPGAAAYDLAVAHDGGRRR